ncbi:NADPH2:quinone reductase [Andreprevotia lacus DSM 23236]|jgi:NADPH2:quinone reductase|uniref:NADPH2:quinone reductase n=1 Tax=Andreprevotia lacus DSM 23236 TaxID=1121001 RepID=A0A1W1Y0R9_9NEIS|nr:quinone oxidoreductase [Andreprevotia lacus]SMC29746.1 NADPH2:quinone reductase [Andreprevotia lacus DSM 23236]
MRALSIRIQQHGDPSVLEVTESELPSPAVGEVLIRQSAAGVNFIDTYHRSGLYPIALPGGLGVEAAGVVEAIGAGVHEFKPGDRVAYAGGAPGAYASHRIMPAARVVPVPAPISEEVAAATLLRGMTAQYLLKRTFKVESGMTVLIHAAAGGVGQIACQWARALGARVIGTVGNADKAALAARWCDLVIDYSHEDVAAQVRAFTAGRGVPVVYDGVGAATFEASLDSLAPRGMLVSFGNASGPVPPFSPGILAQKGSLFLTRPTLGHYTLTRQELIDTAEDYFTAVSRGDVIAEVHQRYALADAAQAHRDLEARKTTGSTLLIP